MNKLLPIYISLFAFLSCGGSNETKNTDTASTTTTTSAPKSMIEQTASNSPEGIALQNLMNQNNCAACHLIDAQSIGPSYVDVAKKYDNNNETISYLSEKILKGGVGVWGQVPMTEHPDMTQAEAESLAKDIMALKNVAQ